MLAGKFIVQTTTKTSEHQISFLGLSRVLWWPKLCHFFWSRFILVQMLDLTKKIWHDFSRLLVQQTTTFKRIWSIPFSELFLASDIGGPLWNLGWCHFLLQIWNKLEAQNSFKIVRIFSRFLLGGSGDVSMLRADFFHEKKKHVFSARLR